MLRKFLILTIVFFLLLQPLLVSVVYAEEVKMKYNDPNHLHAPKEVNGVTYQYDANGNLTDDGERTISWNQDNLPVKITKGDVEIKFYYNANGQRVAKEVKKISAGETTKTIYVNQYLQKEITPQGEITTKYYFANGRVAVRNTPSGGESTLTFLHQDHLGSTVLATDANSQSISDSLSYFPYGNQVSISQSVNVSMNYLFTGQEKDSESDLYNYNARLYNPRTGVFISADIVGGGNRYAYAANNPMVFIDPSGHDAWSWVTRLVSGGSKISFVGEFVSLVGISMYFSGKAMGSFWNWLEPHALEYAEVQEMFRGGGEERIKAQYAKGTRWAETMQSTGESLVYAGLGIESLGQLSQFAGSVLGYKQAGKELSLESKYFTNTGEPTQELLDVRKRVLQTLDMYKTEDFENIFVVGSQVKGKFEPTSDLDILIQPMQTGSSRSIEDAMSEQRILKELNPLYTDNEILDFFFQIKKPALVKQRGPFIHVFTSEKGPFLNEPAFDFLNLKWIRKDPASQ